MTHDACWGWASTQFAQAMLNGIAFPLVIIAACAYQAFLLIGPRAPPRPAVDSFNALNVMLSLRHLCQNGRTVITTIHQPRSNIYNLFDNLLLLSEGKTMYFGKADRAVVCGHFTRLESVSSVLS
jgi:ABC-type cobalamin/Fe3+-siderophores transport system ATPase subunit